MNRSDRDAPITLYVDSAESFSSRTLDDLVAALSIMLVKRPSYHRVDGVLECCLRRR